MIRSSSALLLCALLAAGTCQADELKARIQIPHSQLLGTITGQSSDGVQFRTPAGETTKIPGDQISNIRFSIDKWDPKEFQQSFQNQDFKYVYTQLSQTLAPYRTYAIYPSNLTSGFFHWMASAYWQRDYALATELSDALSQSADSQLKNQALFYQALIQLESGSTLEAKALIKNSERAQLCPPESAARMYIEARFAQEQKNYIEAIKLATRLLARYPGEVGWVINAELLCAELYFQMEMPDSAESVLTDITQFCADPKVLKQAAAIAAKKK